PGLRLRPLRGRRRARPAARRPRAVDRRLRPDRCGTAGARRHRRGDPPPARRHRRRVDDRGIVRGRAPRVSAIHATAVLPRPGRAGNPDVGRSWRRGPLARRPGAGEDPGAPSGPRPTGRPGRRAPLSAERRPRGVTAAPWMRTGVSTTPPPPRARVRAPRSPCYTPPPADWFGRFSAPLAALG